MRTSKILTVIGITAAAVAIAFFIGWYASREPKPAGTGSRPGSTAGAEKAATKASGTTPDANEVVIIPITNPPPADGATTTGSTNLTADDWEEKFDEVFESDLATDKMAEKMLEIYPHLAPDKRQDAIGHILNLVPDEGFAPVGKILLNPKTPVEISDDIMNDMGNRPGVIRMPLILQVARTPDHPKAAEAKELLELYIEPEEDPGNDWNKWEEAMKKYLEENPD